MNEDEYKKLTDETFEKMRKQYPHMTLGDIQSVVMFIKMFEEQIVIMH